MDMKIIMAEILIIVICLTANVCPNSNKAVIKKKMNVANSILWYNTSTVQLGYEFILYI